MMHILFGAGTWGAGGNLVAWVICGIPTIIIGLWHHRKAMHARFDRIERKLFPHDNPGTVAGQAELSDQDDEHKIFGFHARHRR